MNTFIICLLLSPLCSESTAPIPLKAKVRHAVDSIVVQDILGHVNVLCSPDLAGRKAGGPGARAAADYIALQFRKSGLRPGGAAGTYFQTFKIRPGYLIKSSFELEGHEGDGFARGKDYMPVHIPSDAASVAADCVLAGYGIVSEKIKFDEYRGLDVKGKAVIVFSGVPWNMETNAWIRRIEKRSFDSLAFKARVAASNGARMLVVVENPIGWRRRLSPNDQLRLPDREFPIDSPIPVVQVSRLMAEKLIGLPSGEIRLLASEIAQERASHSRAIPAKVKFEASISGQARIGRNVIGILPGSDRELQKQAIVIGAHYDHLGERAQGTFFGANDNASGVSAVLEVAQAFSMLMPRPRRAIVFIAFAAEEIGKLGSNYYVSRPSVPMDQTVMMINFDMVGRNAADEAYAVGTRSSPELHEIHQAMNRHVGLRLQHPASFRLGRSDHTAFYFGGVPIMYLFGGLHDGYHSPDDTVDKLVPMKTERIARLAFLTAQAVAERPERLSFWSADVDFFGEKQAK